jgi:hypothetical protein
MNALMKLLSIIILLVLFVAAVWTSDGNVRASILGLIAAVTLALLAQYYARVRAIQASHFPEKRAAYKLLFDLLFDLIRDVKNNKPMSGQKLENKMMNFKKELMIWGSYDTMEALQEFDSNDEKMSTREMNLRIDRLLKAARKDLGHDDSAVPDGGIVALLLDEEGREQLLDDE